MGNRGILHDDAQTIVRQHAHQNWITCALAFKGRRRSIMAPGRYTELFFLDEATAFAAGHRPCAECRRERYKTFTRIWRHVHGEPAPGRPLSQTIDRVLHAQRIARGGRKVVHAAEVTDLPTGAVFAHDGAPVLVKDGQQFDWHPDGYTARQTPVTGPVDVLTPAAIIALFRQGLRPLWP